MQGRIKSSVLVLLTLTLAVSHDTPCVNSSLVLRGRWTVTVDGVSKLRAHSDHLSGLVDQQRSLEQLDRHSSPYGDRRLIDRLLQTLEHQVLCYILYRVAFKKVNLY